MASSLAAGLIAGKGSLVADLFAETAEALLWLEAGPR